VVTIGDARQPHVTCHRCAALFVAGWYGRRFLGNPVVILAAGILIERWVRVADVDRISVDGDTATYSRSGLIAALGPTSPRAATEQPPTNHRPTTGWHQGGEASFKE
jgi:hypothetical protein